MRKRHLFCRLEFAITVDCCGSGDCDCRWCVEHVCCHAGDGESDWSLPPPQRGASIHIFVVARSEEASPVEHNDRDNRPNNEGVGLFSNRSDPTARIIAFIALLVVLIQALVWGPQKRVDAKLDKLEQAVQEMQTHRAASHKAQQIVDHAVKSALSDCKEFTAPNVLDRAKSSERGNGNRNEAQEHTIPLSAAGDHKCR